jgi:hypothetical protein
MVIVGLRDEATRHLVQRGIRLAHSAEPAAPCLAVEEQLARARLPRALFAVVAGPTQPRREGV